MTTGIMTVLRAATHGELRSFTSRVLYEGGDQEGLRPSLNEARKIALWIVAKLGPPSCSPAADSAEPARNSGGDGGNVTFIDASGGGGGGGYAGGSGAAPQDERLDEVLLRTVLLEGYSMLAAFQAKHRSEFPNHALVTSVHLGEDGASEPVGVSIYCFVTGPKQEPPFIRVTGYGSTIREAVESAITDANAAVSESRSAWTGSGSVGP